MASVDSSWISWGVGVFLLKPLKWTLSNMLGDNKVPAEEVLVAVELLKVGVQETRVASGVTGSPQWSWENTVSLPSNGASD